MKFSVKDIFSNLLKKSLIEKFIFCAVIAMSPYSDLPHAEFSQMLQINLKKKRI